LLSRGLTLTVQAPSQSRIFVVAALPLWLADTLKGHRRHDLAEPRSCRWDIYRMKRDRSGQCQPAEDVSTVGILSVMNGLMQLLGSKGDSLEDLGLHVVSSFMDPFQGAVGAVLLLGLPECPIGWKQLVSLRKYRLSVLNHCIMSEPLDSACNPSTPFP
jgi:hypothetical protein